MEKNDMDDGITISFNKQEMIDFLIDYTNMLYDENPPKSIFDDNSQYLPDYVDGYFSGYESNETQE